MAISVLPFLLAAVCGLLAAATGLFLASGAAPLLAHLPLGPLSADLPLALDALSALFLLIVLVAATASFTSCVHLSTRQLALMVLFVAGMVLALLAADMIGLIAGFETMSIASLILLLTGDAAPRARDAAKLYAGMAALAALCLVAASALPASLDFAGLRLHPPGRAAGGAVLVLVLVGAGSKAGLAPLHVWLPGAHAAAPGPVSALMSGAMTKVAVYIIIRFTFDLLGPVQPLALGAALLLLGAGTAVIGSLRATVETDIKAVLACTTIEGIGLLFASLGIALAARSADLPAAAALALGAALLQALAHGLFKPLLFLAAGAVQHAAGSRDLDRLGGLAQRMPVTTLCVMLAGASLAGVPLSAGFAADWMLLQAVLAAPRLGGLAFQVVACIAAGGIALALGLAAVATVRLIGIAFLGRPRTPRGAAAEEAAWPQRAALLGLSALLMVVGLLPGLTLALAGPALRLLTGADLATRAGPLALRAQDQGALYAPLGLLLAAGLAMSLAMGWSRARAAPGNRTAPLWDGGFGAPPAWLPFGDPQAQAGAAGLTQMLRRILGRSLLRGRETVGRDGLAWSVADPAQVLLIDPLGRLAMRLAHWAERLNTLNARQGLAVMFAVLVALLVLVAAVGRA